MNELVSVFSFLDQYSISFNMSSGSLFAIADVDIFIHPGITIVTLISNFNNFSESQKGEWSKVKSVRRLRIHRKGRKERKAEKYITKIINMRR